MKKLLISLMMLTGMLVSGVALAEHGHGHGGGHEHGHGHFGVGVYFGVPYPYYPYPYYSYPYYYPPVVAVPVPSEPPVYIEQNSTQPPSQQATGYWYHCDNPEGYFPYIKECPGGWKTVTPTPPPPQK